MKRKKAIESGADSNNGAENESKQKKHNSSRSKYKHVTKLLSLAAEGKHQKVAKLLHKHKDLNINSFNSEGLTALHQMTIAQGPEMQSVLMQAARYGHEEAVQVLLQHGADSKAEDFNGSTAAHLAASKGEVGVLALLLQASSGLSVADASEAADLKHMLQLAMDSKLEQKPATKQPIIDERSAMEALQALESDSEDEWTEKLRMNASYDDPFQEDILGSNSSTWESWDYDSFIQPDIGPEDEEAYARRMWEDMQRKQRSRNMASEATADTWAKADSAQERRKKASEEAKEHSKRILEEEQAKDRAWRQAVLQGDQGAKRAAYEAKWQTLVTISGPVLYADIPWLPEIEDRAQALILYGVQGAAERKKRLRLELMRWHPDKFVARFGNRVIGGDRERVLEGVKRVSQVLNSLSTQAM